MAVMGWAKVAPFLVFAVAVVGLLVLVGFGGWGGRGGPAPGEAVRHVPPVVLLDPVGVAVDGRPFDGPADVRPVVWPERRPTLVCDVLDLEVCDG
jgi:hypothetical protein